MNCAKWFKGNQNIDKRNKSLSSKSAKIAITAILSVGTFIPIGIWGAGEMQQPIPYSYSDATKLNHFKGLNPLAEKPIFPFSPVVQLDTGNIRGEVFDRVVRWRGIPYANVTRWGSPTAPEKWSGIKETTEEGSQFIQVNKDIVNGNDSLLSLDVYRPNSSDTNLPILFFVHGGGNQRGSASDMDATQLATTANVVVVSVNYRLGLLGFINLPALKTGDAEIDSGNFALLDLNRALDWTIKNSQAFGGDSKNITISGVSSGAQDVLDMVISPIFKGKFQKVLALHGGMITANPTKSQKVVARALAPLAVKDGKASTRKKAEKWLLSTDSGVKTWLMGLSSSTLARVFHNSGNRMAKFPHAFADGNVIPSQGFETQSYAEVPVMLISGFDEFSYIAGQDPMYSASYYDDSLLLKKENKDLLNSFEFANKYGSELYRYYNTTVSAEKLLPHSKQPIYTALIKWGSDERFVGKKMQMMVGSYHGIAMPILTGNLDHIGQKYPNAFTGQGYMDMRTKFIMYISNFLHSGNPNSLGLPLWSKWSLQGSSDMIFDADAVQANIKQGFGHTNYNDISTRIKQDSTVTNFQRNRVIHEVLNGRWWSTELDKEYNSVDFWLH